MKFDVRYYLVVILFILFDLETAFLFPWAVSLKGTWSLRVLAIGVRVCGYLDHRFVYMWKKGALDWE